MLTGHKPFLVTSISKPDTFYRTRRPVPPKHFNPELSSLSEEAILKAIAQEPAQRHSDISCFLTALGIPSRGRHWGEDVLSFSPNSVPLGSQAEPISNPLQAQPSGQSTRLGASSAPTGYQIPTPESLGIPADTGNQATSMEAVPISLVSDLSEQADLAPAPMRYDIEMAETPTATLDILSPAPTVHPTQTRVSAEPEDNVSMEAFKLYTLADSLSYSPDHYPMAQNLLANAVTTDPEISTQTSVAYAGPLSKHSAKLFFKWRWIGVAITCLVAVCIIATSSLALFISHSALEHKTIPAIVTTIDPRFLTLTAAPTLSTPTPRATPTPEQRPTIAPSPTARPTVPIQPTPTPTPKPHGHH
jgi:hypothetical protein